MCRLAKRWLSSHFLLEYFEEEAIDLICAYLFVNPSTCDAPKSLLVGFLRFLELLVSFDWKSQPLIIDPDREINSLLIAFKLSKNNLSFLKLFCFLFFCFLEEQLLDAKLRFQDNRASLAPVYIITHFDVGKPNSTFTREKPTIQNLCRVVLQAKHSLNLLKSLIQNFEPNESFKVN